MNSRWLVLLAACGCASTASNTSTTPAPRVPQPTLRVVNDGTEPMRVWVDNAALGRVEAGGTLCRPVPAADSALVFLENYAQNTSDHAPTGQHRWVASFRSSPGWELRINPGAEPVLAPAPRCAAGGEGP